MKFPKIFNRKKQNFDYEIEADKGNFTLILHYYVSKTHFLQGLLAVQKRIGKKVGTLDEFEAPEKARVGFMKLVKQAIPQVEAQAARDGKRDFKILLSKITQAKYRKKDDRYYVDLIVEGVCAGD